MAIVPLREWRTPTFTVLPDVSAPPPPADVEPELPQAASVAIPSVAVNAKVVLRRLRMVSLIECQTKR
jgi:hypothetical protein